MNPWEKIKLNDYNEHMRDPRVGQLKSLNMIMAEQMKLYSPRSVAVLGSAGGNGFEHLFPAGKIYAIDINEDYLQKLNEGYGRCLGKKLELVHADLNDYTIPKCDLLICNLIIEYVGTNSFARLLKRSEFGIASCVIQKNCGNSFVTPTAVANKLSCLKDFHHDINEEDLEKELGLKVVFRYNYPLPNNKEFARMDFKRRTVERSF
jgi:SAM-dependent methyltransferase